MAGLTAGVIQAQKELREAGAAAYPSGIPVVHGVAAVGGVGEWADPSDSEQALTITSARVFTSGKEVRIQFSTWMVASEYPANGWMITAGARSITVLSGLVFSGGITLFTDEEIYKDEVVAGAFSDSTGSVTRFPIRRDLASTSFAITNGSEVPAPVATPVPGTPVVTSTGRLLSVPFDSAIAAYTSGAGISLTGACFVSCSTSGSTLNIVVSGVLPGEAVTVSYDAGAGALMGADGGAVASFGPLSATNSSALAGTVAALLNFNAANGSIVFDDAADPLNWTRIGSSVISTAASKFGGSAAIFGSATDSIHLPGAAANYAAISALSNLSRSFTIQCWVNPNASGTTRYIFTTKANEPTKTGLSCYMTTGNRLAFGVRPDSSVITFTANAGSGGVFTAGTWRHVAVCFNHVTGALTCFADGVAGTSATKPTGTTWGAGATPEISTYGSGGSGSTTLYGMNSYCDDFRIDLDVVRYPENFTPPTYQLAMPA